MSTRRKFLAAAAVAGASAVARGIDPIVRPTGVPGNKALTLSLAAYSFRQALDLAKPTMTLFDFLDMAATLPLDAVELTSYYFAETTPAYLKKLRDHAAGKKLAVSGVPVRNDFCLADPAKLRGEIAHVKAWTDRAADLGAATVRVFAGNLPKGDTLEATQRRVVASLEECCAHAETRGVLLALENHGGITATPAQLLALVKPVRSKALGVNVDTGNFKTADPYADVAAIAPYGVVVQVKTEVFPAGRPAQDADLAKVVGILRSANYHGAVVLEYEAKPDAKVAVPKHLATLRKLLDAA